MASPLDPGELDALMQAIQEGRVATPEGGVSGAPVVPYDLTSQDRIIRGQMPTLDSINDRIASLFGRSLAGRTRLDIRASAGAATLLKFSDIQPLLTPPATVGVLTLGSGHGPGVLVLEGELGSSLLAGALGDRKARPLPPSQDGRTDLTSVERMVLRHLLTMFSEAMHVAWADVLPFRPEVLRFESDPRMAMIAPASDVAILCPFELAGTISGRMLLVFPYAAVEPAKKILAAPPRLGSAPDGDARFSAALAHELEQAEVEIKVEIGRRRLSLSDLMAVEIGAVLTLDRSENSPLPIFVEGRLKMTGVPRVVGGSLAVIVERAISGTSTARASSPLIAALEASMNPPPGGPQRPAAA
jgi:flagellar motor switch protein FliM